jgi:hypothetical protein
MICWALDGPSKKETEMKNKWTTISGALLVLGAVATALGQLIAGDTPNIEALIAAVSGLGLLKASDGSL